MSFEWGLTLVFIALKLTGHIDWSWVWVLSPLWIVLIVELTSNILKIIEKRLHKGGEK